MEAKATIGGDAAVRPLVPNVIAFAVFCAGSFFSLVLAFELWDVRGNWTGALLAHFIHLPLLGALHAWLWRVSLREYALTLLVPTGAVLALGVLNKLVLPWYEEGGAAWQAGVTLTACSVPWVLGAVLQRGVARLRA